MEKTDQLISKEHFIELNASQNCFSFWTILRQWFFLALLFFLVVQFPYWWVFLLVWPLVAAKQHALAGLAHEAAHKTLFSDKILNDWVGRLFCCYPILVSLYRYRAIHLLHHKKLYTHEDPDIRIYERYPVSRSFWKKILWRDFFALTVFKNLIYFIPLPSYFYPQNKDPIQHYPYQSDGWFILVFHLLILTIFTSQNLLLTYLLFWWVPYLSLLQVLLRIRGALEHGGVDNIKNPYQNTRTTLDHPLTLFFIAPVGLNYHLEHHLYPTIPWFNLIKIHKLIMPQLNQTKCPASYRLAIKSLLK